MAIKVFSNIKELLTLEGASRKQGRRILESDLSIIKDAALIIDKGIIVWRGPESKIPSQFKKKPRTSLKGATVLPAFSECHTHLVFAGHRAGEFEKRNQGLSYQEIARQGGGIISTMKATREASVKDLIRIAQARADRFVAQGVTTIEGKSGYGLNLESETKILEVQKRIVGARIVSTYLGAHAVPPEFKSAEQYVANIVKNDLPLIAKKKLAERVDIFVEEGYFPLHVARPYLNRAKELGFDLVIHADQLTLSGGARLAMAYKARSADHLLKIKNDEVIGLGKSDVTCVLLPTSDLYLKTNYPPARALIEAGARVALATDFNPGTSPTQDLALVGLLARLEMKMSLPEVISAYTLGAAFALGLESQIGSLDVGKCADFISVDGNWADLFYSAGHMPVSKVWRAGRRIST